ncbi:MAG TPA: sigma-70 family RNA polymerase sigma factor [Blastocatellia bacterium]|nr:sigma-70 family RNA polymerase sigma factor [Blastocatellia bacterium]
MKTADDYARTRDRDLVAACLKGDQQAWESLVVRYRRLIYSIPVKARLSPDDAADIFQSVCLKLLENLASLRDHEKIVSWLITTTSRECWRVAARQRRDNPVITTDEDDTDSVSDLASDGPLADEQLRLLERQQAVRTGLASLPEKCRRLLEMLFYQKDELTYAEIARRSGMPVSSIGPTRARCLEKLKKNLEGKL